MLFLMLLNESMNPQNVKKASVQKSEEQPVTGT